MGGNDFIPKFYGKSHTTVLKLLFQCEVFQNTLFNIDDSQGDLTISINRNVYAEFAK